MTDKKQERAVVHLEKDGKHYYYGNLKALCDNWAKEDIGVAYNYLKNYNLSPDKPYVGKQCIIRKGIIITSPQRSKESSVPDVAEAATQPAPQPKKNFVVSGSKLKELLKDK